MSVVTDLDIQAVLGELRLFAEEHQSYAYRFYYPQQFLDHEILHGHTDARLVMVYVAQDGSYKIVSCDVAGRPLDQQPPPPLTDALPYVIGGKHQVAFQRTVSPPDVVPDEWVPEPAEEAPAVEAPPENDEPVAEAMRPEVEDAIKDMPPTSRSRIREIFGL